MMKRFLFSGLLFLVTCLTAFGQDRKSPEVIMADKYFSVEDYFLAADLYRKEVAKHPDNIYASYQLAECYRSFFDYPNAEIAYQKVVTIDSLKFPHALFHYAMMLKTNGKYQDASKIFKRFIELYTPIGDNDTYVQIAILEENGCTLALKEMNKPQRDFGYLILEKPVNTDYSDFSTAIFKHDSSIVIASSRLEDKHDDIYGKLGGSYLDNFLFDKAKDSSSGWKEINLDSAQNFKTVNSIYNDGAGCFNHDKSKYYFTRCAERNKDNTQIACAIYVTKFVSDVWETPKKLNASVNTPGYWTAHPCLSPSGDTLFFSSKRPGGYGNQDIWFSLLEDKNQEDSWGEPINVGPPINTAYTEISPYFYPKEKALFFSSTGHEGFGGLDIYLAKGEKLDTLRNIGLPFNSNRDDFYFVLGDKKGYMTSNRDGGSGNDDIYWFSIESKEALLAAIESDSLGDAKKLSIKGHIVDDNKLPVEGIGVLLTDSAGNVLRTTRTDKNGYFEFKDLDAGIDYRVTLEDDGGTVADVVHETMDELKVITDEQSQVIKFKDKMQTITISGKIVDDNGDPSEGVDMVLQDEQSAILQSTHTDKQGKFVFANLDPNKNYKVAIRDNNGKLTEVNYKSGDIVVSGSKKALNTTSLAEATKGKRASRVLFENIYFDFDKYELRPEAINVLNELSDFVGKYPNVKVEILGNTDAIGSNSYNLVLSKNRSNMAYKYLLEKGVAKSVLIMNSAGETQPISSNKNPVGRQLNRRVEFYIVNGGNFEARAMAYIPEQSTSLAVIAKKFNMTVDELKQLNSIQANEVDAYRPMRVRRSGAGDVISPLSLMSASKNASLNELRRKRETEQHAHPMSAEEYNRSVVYGKDDQSGYYVVLPRNTLYSISKLFGCTMAQLNTWNHLTPDHPIKPGQVLRVKEKTAMSIDEYTKNNTLADMGVTVSHQQGQEVMIQGVLHYVVKPGDTFYSISKKYGKTPDQLRDLNHLPDFSLRPGMSLKVK